MLLMGRTLVDEREHGAMQRFAATDPRLLGERAHGRRDQLDGGVAVDLPVRDQQRARLGRADRAR